MPYEELEELRSDVLIVVHDHQVPLDGGWTDPVWAAVRTELGVPDKRRSRPWKWRFDEYERDLWVQKLRQDARDQPWLLVPDVYPYKAGDFLGHEIEGGRSVLLFHAKVRLNTGGPTMPALAVARDLVEIVAPRLVLSVGLGGGVLPTDMAGDVVVSNAARLRLRGCLEGARLNGQTCGGRLAIEPRWFEGLALEAMDEPPLIAPSPNYQDAGSPIHPDLVRDPEVIVRQAPVITSPLLSEHGFQVAGLTGSSALADEAAAVDMDAAATAHACGSDVDFCAVIGVAVPALDQLEGDLDHAIRDAWTEVFMQRHARQAAANAAAAVRRIIEV
jgi:hypothetical protein